MPLEYYENSILNKGGEERIIAWHNATLTDEAGNVIGTLSSGEDITERKRAEEAVRDALAQSRKHAAEASALLKSSGAILEYQDFEAVEKVIFDFCKGLVGATAGYIALASKDGKQNELLFLDAGDLPCTVDPDLPMPIRGLRAEAYNSGKPVYENHFVQSEWNGLLPSGHARLENVLFAPLLLKGRAVGVLGLANKRGGFTDDDARLAAAFADHAVIALQNSQNLQALLESEARYRRLSESLEETVRQKVAELQQAESLAALGQMVSIVAHEVRNPLQNIQMGIDTLRREIEGDDEKAGTLEEIDYGVSRLNRIIRDLLDYSRPVKLQYSARPVHVLVGQALKSVSHRLQNITTRVELEQGDREISVDVVKFTAVLVNLMSNAAEAMPDGGDLAICSRFSEYDGIDMLQISITDSGCGIAEENLERIHEPFFTTKTKGTGLGIPVCKKIIEAHNGTLDIASRPEGGTAAVIAVPI